MGRRGRFAMTWASIFFTKTTNTRDLPNKIILVVEMKAQERTMKDQPMGI
jgi:hypothetical protein